MGCPTHYIGFMSEDSRAEVVRPEPPEVYHMGGTSQQKGSSKVMRIWERHPEWPLLNIIWHTQELRISPGLNINWRRDFVAQSELREIQNRSAIHLCPSEAEGFGHYLMESMSCAALTITTDAPPMNELVTADRGILVPYSDSAPQGLGTNFYVDELRLEEAISAALHLPRPKRQALASEGGAYFLRQQQAFPARLKQVLEEIA